MDWSMAQYLPQAKKRSARPASGVAGIFWPSLRPCLRRAPVRSAGAAPYRGFYIRPTEHAAVGPAVLSLLRLAQDGASRPSAELPRHCGACLLGGSCMAEARSGLEAIEPSRQKVPRAWHEIIGRSLCSCLGTAGDERPRPRCPIAIPKHQYESSEVLGRAGDPIGTSSSPRACAAAHPLGFINLITRTITPPAWC